MLEGSLPFQVSKQRVRKVQLGVYQEWAPSIALKIRECLYHKYQDQLINQQHILHKRLRKSQKVTQQTPYTKIQQNAQYLRQVMKKRVEKVTVF